ncbi:MAG: hypothetical protein GXO58_00740 [Thermodesulfobacteria bacterium]|nr:hypothetical protein [Thermodesulfobacteriota bacterium]
MKNMNSKAIALIFLIVLGGFWGLSGRGLCGEEGQLLDNWVSNSDDSLHVLPQGVLRRALDSVPTTELTKRQFSFFIGSRQYVATTTINQSLQAYLDSLFEKALGAASAVVCIDPISGRVIAMSGFDRDIPYTKVWTDRLVPSASLFKIVTAAGVMELYSMTPDTTLYFNGGRHTLYKYQLKSEKTKYTTAVTLKEAFALSINPIFGKLGINYLKEHGLMEMAKRFLWQTPIPFELKVAVSPVKIGTDDFGIAEVASGFNRETRVTALHEALISAGIANSGVIMAPSFIDMVVEKGGEIVYQDKFYPLVRAVNPRTASLLRTLMEETVKTGTAKRAFRGWQQDEILKDLVIGGKTGTIDSHDHRLRYDLFSGFACSNINGRCLAVGVFVAHEGVLGRRSASYARLAFKKYFELMQE